MTVVIYGKRRIYEIENLPQILRDVAIEIEKGGDPPKYCCEEVEKALGTLGKKLKVSMEVHMNF